jgi:hypothetical protein
MENKNNEIPKMEAEAIGPVDYEIGIKSSMMESNIADLRERSQIKKI